MTNIVIVLLIPIGIAIGAIALLMKLYADDEIKRGKK